MSQTIKTMTAGNMWKVLVKTGDKIKEGETLFIMEVMKTEVHHTSPVSGIVTAVHVKEGQEGVDPDTDAVEID